jgi:hypothetical protein
MVVASEPHRVSTDDDSKKVELLSEEDMDGGEGREGEVLRRNGGGKAARNTNLAYSRSAGILGNEGQKFDMGIRKLRG